MSADPSEGCYEVTPGRVNMHLQARYAGKAWGSFLMRGPLTDKRIEFYRQRGRYTRTLKPPQRKPHHLT